MRIIKHGRRMLIVGVLLTITSGLSAGGTAFATVSPEVSAGPKGSGGAVRLAAGVELTGPVDAPPKEASATTSPAPLTNQAAQARRVTVTYGPHTIKPGEVWNTWATCPGGMVATGGGVSNASAGGMTLHHTNALEGGAGWLVTTSSTVDTSFTAYAICFSGLSNYQHSILKGIMQPGTDKTIIVGCLEGQMLGGGGWSDTYRNRLYSNYRNLISGRWFFGMRNLDSAPRTVTGQAVCGNGVNNYNHVANSITAPPGQTTSVLVSCPAGTWVLSGGGGFGIGGSLSRFTDSYPEGIDKWRLYVHNDSPDSSAQVTVHATCGT
jgi:hypothetical protein